MTELEALAKDCIENHTHKLIDKPTKQDIYLREESIYISGYRECERRNKKDMENLATQSMILIQINAELEEKVKELKCCGNCQTVRNAEGVCYFLKDGTCNPRTRIKWVQKNDSKVLEKQYPII